MAHVGIVQDGSPFVIPMAYARKGNQLLLHGSISSRLMKVRARAVLQPSCGTWGLSLYMAQIWTYIPCDIACAHTQHCNCELCMQAIKSGTEVCVTVTVLDGLVLARSPFHHSMNYRSVVVIGHPQVISPSEFCQSFCEFCEFPEQRRSTLVSAVCRSYDAAVVKPVFCC